LAFRRLGVGYYCLKELPMNIAAKIQKYVQKLPTASQTAVLDFAQFLLNKAESDLSRREELDWSSLSLAAAMKGIEAEDTPEYTVSDLKVLFE
jgi:hypothetical protein